MAGKISMETINTESFDMESCIGKQKSRYHLLGLVSVILLLGLGGCADMSPSPINPGNPQYSAVLPPPPRPAEQNDGSIYQSATAVSLFSDQRAYRIGDLLTVVFDESTNASKSADTSTSRDTRINAAAPTVFGQSVLYHGVPVLSAGLTSKNGFTGKGQSTQSNTLSGTLTVSVAQVLSNGDLVVQGEKRLMINQGSEYIRLRGIVRAADITPQDTVLSTQIADAHIAYVGRGQLNDANRAGWLARLFNAWWPF